MQVSMLRSFLTWCGGSLRGQFVLSLIALSLPILLLGVITNICAGYPTADLGMLVSLSILAAIPPPIFIWYNVTLPRIKRRTAQRR